MKRLRRDGGAAELLSHVVRGQVRGLNVAMHNFMSAADVRRPRTEVVEERLAACLFRGAVLRDGAWTAVPMCEMNAEVRERLYADQITAAGGAR